MKAEQIEQIEEDEGSASQGFDYFVYWDEQEKPRVPGANAKHIRGENTGIAIQPIKANDLFHDWDEDEKEAWAQYTREWMENEMYGLLKMHHIGNVETEVRVSVWKMPGGARRMSFKWGVKKRRTGFWLTRTIEDGVDVSAFNTMDYSRMAGMFYRDQLCRECEGMKEKLKDRLLTYSCVRESLTKEQKKDFQDRLFALWDSIHEAELERFRRRNRGGEEA